jgi:hypothetical protein
MVEVDLELFFLDSVHPFDLLLFPQLVAVIRKLAPALTVLAGRIPPSFEGALVRVAPLTLQEKLDSFTAAKPANGSRVTRQMTFLLSSARV